MLFVAILTPLLLTESFEVIRINAASISLCILIAFQHVSRCNGQKWLEKMRSSIDTLSAVGVLARRIDVYELKKKSLSQVHTWLIDKSTDEDLCSFSLFPLCSFHYYTRCLGLCQVRDELQADALIWKGGDQAMQNNCNFTLQNYKKSLGYRFCCVCRMCM